MKTRKILALVMAIALLAVSMTVVASAEEAAERPTSVYTIQNTPNLTYTDADCFNPAGLTISDGSTTISYDTDSQFFTFSVADDQPLTVYMTQIEVFYKGESCGFLDIVVKHLGSADGEIVYINNHHHGQICDVCGVTCYNESHEEFVDYWVPNGDASLLVNETESGHCSKCDTRVSHYIEGTATYVTAFAEVDILVTILGLVASIVQAFALI